MSASDRWPTHRHEREGVREGVLGRACTPGNGKARGNYQVVATKILGSLQASSPFYRVAEAYFPSMRALEACAGSPGAKEVLYHAANISTGGPPVIRIRLCGELRAEHLDQLEAEVERAGPPTALDLEEVHLVDVEAVRFLNVCVADGVSVLHCSRYIREWMLRERGPKERNHTRKKGQAPLKDEDGKNV